MVETSKSEIVMPSFGDKCKVFIKGSRPTSASSPHLVLRDLMMLAVICWAVVTVAPGTRYTQQLSLPASYSCITLGLTCTVSGHTGHSRSAKVDSVNVGFGDPMIPPLVGR